MNSSHAVISCLLTMSTFGGGVVLLLIAVDLAMALSMASLNALGDVF